MHNEKKISLPEAQALILSRVARDVSVREVELSNALGRRLAVDMTATRDSPPFDNSAMDGFALRRQGRDAADFKVMGVSKAGGSFEGRIGAGEAVKIMTGAVIPEGADTVVMKESCDDLGATVRVNEMPRLGANIRRRGEDIVSGRVAVRSGTIIGPVEMAELASLGRARVPVFDRPVIAVLSTGTELVDVSESPREDQIFDSNSYAIASLVSVFGGEPRRLGRVVDEPSAMEHAVREALSCDALVTSGGVSVGEYDLVRETLAKVGCEEVFWGVAMRPGRPFFFGKVLGKPVFGLPGNAVSAMVTFTMLVGPAVLAMSGDSNPLPRPGRARLTKAVGKKHGFTYLARVHVELTENGLIATPVEGQGSHQVFGMAGSNALCILPYESEGAHAGDFVEVVPFGHMSWK